MEIRRKGAQLVRQSTRFVKKAYRRESAIFHDNEIVILTMPLSIELKRISIDKGAELEQTFLRGETAGSGLCMTLAS
jgi:hypothetical protein